MPYEGNFRTPARPPRWVDNVIGLAATAGSLTCSVTTGALLPVGGGQLARVGGSPAFGVYAP